MKSSIKTLLVLMALLLPMLLVNLGTRPVYKIQEVRIAETAREMLASGDWGVPRYNGELRLQKPPLPYWLTAASYKASGINATTTRLPAILFGLLTTLLLCAWVQREAGREAAANSALVLAASYIGIRYFRSGEADAVLLFFISAASLLGYAMLHRGGDKLYRALFGLALGLGFLSKGPAALAIPLLTLLAFSLLEKRASKLKDCFSPAGLVLLMVAAFGWYAWIVWKLPDAAQHFVGKQMDETFVRGTHAKPAWWYLAHLFEFFAPWGVLLPLAGWSAWRQRGSTAVPGLIRFAWIWLAVVFALLTLTVNKQMQYALLFAPPLAIILGHYLTTTDQNLIKINRVLFWLFCTATLAGIGYAVHQASWAALPWLALAAAPLVLQQLLKAEALSAPVLLVAGITAMAYLYSEEYLSKEPRKVAAQTIIAAAAAHTPLYQSLKPDDGALSFYAGRVIPPVQDEDMPALLQNNPELWLITEKIPSAPDAVVQVVAASGELKLCRLQRKP